MYILSFKPSNSKYFGSHDPAAVLFKDNEILSLIEEERLTRKKHAPDSFPINAIARVLSDNKITISDVDHMVIPFNPTRWFFAEKMDHASIIKESHDFVYRHIEAKFGKVRVPPLAFYSHHLSHAASAFYLSGFKDSVIITADGTGEREATVIWEGRNGKIEKIKEFLWPDSLGELYSTITGYIGFLPNSHEGKTMGLAPWGTIDPLLKKIFLDKIMHIGMDKYGFQNPELSRSTWEERYNYLEKILPFRRLSEGKRETIEQPYKDMAAIVQWAIEEVISNLVDYALSKVHSKNLCLAGGLAMNVSMNGKLLSSGKIDDIFVQPLAGDNGSILGAAILKYIDSTGKNSFNRMEHLYYGPAYSNNDIENILKGQGLVYRYVDDPWNHAAAMLAENKVIAWYNGRMEAGARSLGNRSMLSNPSSNEMKDHVNELKNREKWRPLALSILPECASEFLDGFIPQCANFMIITRDVKQDKKELIPSAMHIDGSTRPQVVQKETNEPYYLLIKEFYRLTGIPLVINTSLNDRGEPIVESPEQAINLLNKSPIDALFLQNYIIKRT